MNASDLLMDSLRLMGIGMGIVFSFLMLLVGLLRAMSWLALKAAPVGPHPILPASPTSAAEHPDDLIAVIAAAIAHDRARRRSSR